MLVLVASSDSRLRENLAWLIRADGLDVEEATNGLEALRRVFRTQPDAVLVDLGIEEVDGLDLVRMLRAASDLAILVLLSTVEQERGILALEVGADDVVRTSTPPAELIARLRAAVRRSQREVEPGREDPSIVRTGDIEIDRTAQTVSKGGRHVGLSRTEYRLLDALASRVGQAAPHRFLLTTVWGDAYVNEVHYLRVYIGYLRAKLEDDPGEPRYLQSEWGVGYRLAALPRAEVAVGRRRGERDQSPELARRVDD